MDPASLTLAVIASLKDLYFASRFVYETATSAKYYREEQQDLMNEFKYHVVFLELFWKIFVRRNATGTVDQALEEVR